VAYSNVLFLYSSEETEVNREKVKTACNPTEIRTGNLLNTASSVLHVRQTLTLLLLSSSKMFNV